MRLGHASECSLVTALGSIKGLFDCLRLTLDPFRGVALVLAGMRACVPTSSCYRGTSLTRKRTPLGPYRRPMPRVLGGPQVGGRFLMGEVPLYGRIVVTQAV